jgi:hypothetical protein
MQLNTALRHKLGHEAKEYLLTVAYLYVCFGALLLYKAAILRDHGIQYVPLGLALGKALLMAKFMLIGRKLNVGANVGSSRLVYVIAYKSVLFLLLLIALSVVEQVSLGFAHHETIEGALSHLGSGRLGEVLAEGLLLLLILVPYFAYKELDRTLGEGKIRQLLRRRADVSLHHWPAPPG